MGVPTGTHILAVGRLAGTVDEMAPRLAAAIGISAYEARGRVRGPAPQVVATFGDADAARAARDALEAAGFAPLLFGGAEIEPPAGRVMVRSYALERDTLTAAPRAGAGVTVPFDAVTLLLRGTRFYSTVRNLTTRERRRSLGRALLTGGLVLTKEVRLTQASEQQEAEPYLHVYAPGHPVLVFSEGEVVHGLVREPSRAASFVRLVRDLRARMPGAVYDERLLTRAGQALVLGGVLGVERFPAVAIAVLARALGA